MGKFNEYSQKATPEDADTDDLRCGGEGKQTFTVQWNLELDRWETDQCGHQQFADK